MRTAHAARALLCAAALTAGCRQTPADTNGTGGTAPPPGYRITTLVSGLDTPWDLAWGPDGNLWFTERGGRISRFDFTTGRLFRLAQLDVLETGESGLMGMAFHPDFAAQPYVYVAHSYATPGGNIRNRLVRMRYDGARLGPPETLLDGIPGANIHDGARLAIGPDGFLYMTTGDAAQPQLAQDRGSLAGKVLRLTLDGRPAPGNPFGNATYSYGHRNPQGIAFHPRTGALYISEHGPDTDDELNRIEPGRNYGWPQVRGACDEPEEREFCQTNRVVEPLTTWTPTIAPAGIAFYDADLFPGWRGSLLLVALRGERLLRIALSPDGTHVTATETVIRDELGRLRDVLIGPQGEIYLATSNRDGRGRPEPNDDRILRVRP